MAAARTSLLGARYVVDECCVLVLLGGLLPLLGRPGGG